jgi:hypothetical protein
MKAMDAFLIGKLSVAANSLTWKARFSVVLEMELGCPMSSSFSSGRHGEYARDRRGLQWNGQLAGRLANHPTLAGSIPRHLKIHSFESLSD